MCIINYSSAYDRDNSAEKSIVHQIVFWWDFFMDSMHISRCDTHKRSLNSTRDETKAKNFDV